MLQIFKRLTREYIYIFLKSISVSSSNFNKLDSELRIKNKTFTGVADGDGDVITDISTSKYILLSVVPLYNVENARKSYWFSMIGSGKEAYLIKIFSDSNTIVTSENIAMRLVYIEF